MKIKNLNISGQSIIEVIIALALFVIIVGSGIVAILGALTTTRLAEEETQATTYATQGIDAVESIRNLDWNNLVNGTYGLTNSGGFWAFSGSSDNPDGSGKFTRSVTISDVQRNTSGNIVSSGGTVDDESKHILVTVLWDFTPTRNNSVEIESYLTNWQLSRNVPGGGAPVFGSCNEYCINQAYASGSCEPVSPPCANSGGTHKPAGNVYCTGSPTDTCCCF